MNPAMTRRAAWRAWRSDVAQRLDRYTLRAGLAYAAFGAAWLSTGIVFPFPGAGFTVVHCAAGSLLWLVVTMATLVALAVATTAITRGVSVWLAYPVAALAIELTVLAVAAVLHPYAWLVPAPKLPGSAYALSMFMLSACLPAGVFFVHSSNAKHHARLLRAAEAERAAEGDRLAEERLKAELASVDYDLVLNALRRARGARAGLPERADALLTIVAEYLRAAQQRGDTDPHRIARAFAELRRACAAVQDVVEEVPKA